MILIEQVGENGSQHTLSLLHPPIPTKNNPISQQHHHMRIHVQSYTYSLKNLFPCE